jgi:hypothetical protein
MDPDPRIHTSHQKNPDSDADPNAAISLVTFKMSTKKFFSLSFFKVTFTSFSNIKVRNIWAFVGLLVQYTCTQHLPEKRCNRKEKRAVGTREHLGSCRPYRRHTCGQHLPEERCNRKEKRAVGNIWAVVGLTDDTPVGSTYLRSAAIGKRSGQ